jgi:hypothetical protein
MTPIPGPVALTCPTCRDTGSVWDDGVSLLQSHATGEPMRGGREVDCPSCCPGDTFGRHWIGYPDANAWTVTVVDERAPDDVVVHVEHTQSGMQQRAHAATRAAHILTRIAAARSTTDEHIGPAIAYLVRCAVETDGRMEVHDRRHGIRVAIQPTDPHHPANT